jgi:hypothetical protein
MQRLQTIKDGGIAPITRKCEVVKKTLEHLDKGVYTLFLAHFEIRIVVTF